MTLRTGRLWPALGLSSVAVLCLALPAAAGTVLPRDDRAMLRASDLQDVYGHVTHSYTEDLGKGRRPTACENPIDGRIATPKKAAKRAFVKEIAFPAGVVWQNTAFFYATPQEAQQAFREMSKTALAACNLSKVINIGTDGDKVDARVTYTSSLMAPLKGVSRLIVKYDTDLVSAAAPSATYADSYDYSVYAVKGNVITRVGVGQMAQTSDREHSDAQSVAAKVATRLDSLPY